MEEFLTYGAAFKYLRESRGFTIKKACQDIISPQFLSKFEKDNSSISLENFSRLLVRLGATWNDFFKIYQGESTEFLIHHLNTTLNHSATSADIVRASKRKLPYDFKDNPVFRTLTEDAIRVYIAADKGFDWDTSVEQKHLSDYLNQTDTWGEVELSIYQLILQTLPVEMVAYHTNRFCKTLQNDLSLSREEKRALLEILLESLRFLSQVGRNKDTEKLIAFLTDELKKLSYLYYASEVLFFKMLVSYHYFRNGDMRAHTVAKKVYRMYDLLEKEFGMYVMGEEKEAFYFRIQQINKTGKEFHVD